MSPEAQSLTLFQSNQSQLQDEIALRDRIIEQLSAELFRLIQQHPELFTGHSQRPGLILKGQETPSSVIFSPEYQTLQIRLQEVEAHISFYQTQITQRDADNAHLQEVNQDLSDRNHNLELVIQELPEVYRQKFSQRLDQVRDKLSALQTENRQLQESLQSMNYQLEVQNHRATPVELPRFPRLNPHPTLSLPEQCPPPY